MYQTEKKFTKNVISIVIDENTQDTLLKFKDAAKYLLKVSIFIKSQLIVTFI